MHQIGTANMRTHVTDTYLAGNTLEIFCTVCGKEGSELIATECQGKVDTQKILDQTNNRVDTKSECD